MSDALSGSLTGFNTQPPEGGWSRKNSKDGKNKKFQHTAARRRLAQRSYQTAKQFSFQHTAARRRLAAEFQNPLFLSCFNTQPPEGGWLPLLQTRRLSSGSFNTQPPEGGWQMEYPVACISGGFNTQPPEGGWSLS